MSNNKGTQELRPCPFCGHPPRFEVTATETVVRCWPCRASVIQRNPGEDWVRDTWNRRATSHPVPLACRHENGEWFDRSISYDPVTGEELGMVDRCNDCGSVMPIRQENGSNREIAEKVFDGWISTSPQILERIELALDEKDREIDRMRDAIASAADLANTWARESSVPECERPFTELALRDLIDRLWTHCSEKILKWRDERDKRSDGGEQRDEKHWRVSYQDHGPYSELMTKAEATAECLKAGGSYIVDITGGAKPKIIPWRKLQKNLSDGGKA